MNKQPQNNPQNNQLSAKNQNPAQSGQKKFTLHQNIDFPRLEDLDLRLENDEKARDEFESDPKSFMKKEGFNLPPNAEISFSTDYADIKARKSKEGEEELPKFEIRIGHIIISE